MNKISCAVICMLLIVSGASAQITLTQSSYPASVLGTDSLKMTVYASAFPALTAMAPGLWDMSIVADSAPLFHVWHLPNSIHDYADSINEYTTGRFNYQGNTECSIDPGGILEYGVIVMGDSIDLSTITGGGTDTLIISPQNMTYSAPRTKIAFPTTYNSKWSSAYSSDLTIDLSVAGLSYSHAPGFIRRYTKQQDTVTGWGKMRVKDAVGVPSDSFNVLQVQTIITTVDSFFLNGLPFSNALLTTLSITQGATDTIYQQNYYQSQEIVPLAQVTFADGTYSQARRAVTHVKHMIGTTNTAHPLNNTGYSVYPNPMSGNILTVSLPYDKKEPVAYLLTDATGKTVNEGLLQPVGARSDLTLPTALATGTYYLRLKDGSGVSDVLSIEVVN